jgi:Outer membrane protein beta-barrel domain
MTIACLLQDLPSGCKFSETNQLIKKISMKRIFILCMGLCAMTTSFAQQDTTKPAKPDTINIGGMVIIREPGSKDEESKNRDRVLKFNRRKKDKQANLSTNWWIVDLGFSNFNDQTDYTSTAAQAFAPGSTEDWFELRTGKSRSVNIWVVMQRLNLAAHVVNLKYGLGLELNNYHFDDRRIRFNKNPTLIDQSYSGLHKNKLAADYLTAPLMLNFNFTPKKDNDASFGLSAGISAGYLYSARQKVKNGKVDKTKGNFDLRKWKLSYVAEITLGPVRLYGSYAFKSMFEKGLDMTPYNVGLRFSNW